MATTTAEMRRCIGSKNFGIEAHEAPPADFPKQPSRKDGLGRMCKPHWNQYTSALRKAAQARKAEGKRTIDGAVAAYRAVGASVSGSEIRRAKRAAKVTGTLAGETPATTVRRHRFETRLAKVGVASDAGQRMLERAAKESRGPKTVSVNLTPEDEARVIEEADIA